MKVNVNKTKIIAVKFIDPFKHSL